MSRYYEEGYIDANYFDEVVADTGTYYVDGYLEAGYFEGDAVGTVHEATAALVVSSTANASPGIVKSSGADLNGVFAPNILAVASRNGSIDMALQTAFASDFERTRTTDVTLDNIVNLSLQSARIRDTQVFEIPPVFNLIPIASRTTNTTSSLAISFEQTANATRIKQSTATLTGVFSPNIQATASLNGSIDLHATATADANVGTIKQLDATLSTAFSVIAEGGYDYETSAALSVSSALSATAIQYVIGASVPAFRPLNLVDNSLTTNLWSFDNSVYKGGTGSLFIDGTGASGTIQLYANNTNDNNTNLDVAENQDFVFETWIRFDGPTNGVAQFDQEVIDINSMFRLNLRDNTNRLDLYLGNGFNSSTALGIVDGFFYSVDTWYHVSLSRTNNVLTYKINGSTEYTTSDSKAYNRTFGDGDMELRLSSPHKFIDGVYFDSMTYRVGNSEVSGLSSPYIPYNHETTKFLYTFDTSNNLLIDNTEDFTYEAAATLSATTSVTASAGGTSSAESDLTATATITADVDKVVNTSATLATAFATTATADKILTSDASLNSTFAQTSTATRIQQGATSLTGAFAQTTTANIIAGAVFSDSASFELSETTTRIKQIAASLNAFVSTLTAAGKVGDFFVDIDLTATLASTATFTASTSASLDTTATASASGDRIRLAASNLTASATITSDGELVAGTIANLDTTAALDSTAVRAKGLTADFASEFAATATGVTFLGSTTFEGQVNTTLAATPKITRTTSAALDVSTTQTVAGIKAVEASATLTGAFAPSITAVASRAGDIDLAVDSTQTATATKTTETSSTASAQTTLAATGTLTKQLSASPVCEANIASTAGVLVSTTSSISAAFTQTVIGTIIDTTRYVYVVPRESRVFTVDKETRTHTIHKETRTFTLGEL
jgi:hypothetical protein